MYQLLKTGCSVGIGVLLMAGLGGQANAQMDSTTTPGCQTTTPCVQPGGENTTIRQGSEGSENKRSSTNGANAETNGGSSGTTGVTDDKTGHGPRDTTNQPETGTTGSGGTGTSGGNDGSSGSDSNTGHGAGSPGKVGG